MASPQGRINGKAETMIKLYGTPPTRALRAMWLLNELDLAHEVIPIDLGAGEQLTPEFLALNPAAKLPVLVDGDLVISESRSEEHTSELQSLMRISYAVFCLKKK